MKISKKHRAIVMAGMGFLTPLLWTLGSTTAREGGQEEESGKRKITVDDYFRIRDVEDPQLSPDGKWVAYTVTTKNLEDDKNRERIWMVPTAGGEAIPLTAEEYSSEHSRWSPDGKYLAFLSERTDEKKEIWLLNREGGEAEELTNTVQDVDDFVWAPGSDRIVLVLQDSTPDEIAAAKSSNPSEYNPKPRPWVIDRLHFKEDEVGYLDHRRKHLYVFRLSDHSMTQITSGDYDDEAPAWSPDAKSIAFQSNRSQEPDLSFNTDIWVVAADNADEGKQLVRVTANPGADEQPTWSPDGKWIAYTSQREPKLFWYATNHIAIAPAAGGEDKVLTKELDRNSTVPRFSADGKWIYFIADDDGTQNVLRIPAQGGKVERPIGGRLMVDAYSLGRDGSLAAQIGMPDRPDEIDLEPAGGGELKRLTKTNQALMAQLKLGGVDYVHFKSKDGTTVAGYLTKPVDYKPGQRYPTLLIPHGGPVWAHYAEFKFQSQLLAAEGYAVLNPNPRGSSGYGQDYCQAIFADWGNKDFQDDMAMVDFAVEQGIADPNRLGVGGHSYGAISTNLILVQTTRFKAAISNAGEFLYMTNFGHDEYLREWEYELGSPWDHRDSWERTAPFYKVTQIKTPTLILGGNVDWNVPIINGEQMYESLRLRGVPTMLVVYPGEFHEFKRPSFIRDRDERWIFWFNHYVKGEGPAVPPDLPSPTGGANGSF
jgi:dipeptidyl aminopeptidase/acylaminoacyl peptidase